MTGLSELSQVKAENHRLRVQLFQAKFRQLQQEDQALSRERDALEQVFRGETGATTAFDWASLKFLPAPDLP